MSKVICRIVYDNCVECLFRTSYGIFEPDGSGYLQGFCNLAYENISDNIVETNPPDWCPLTTDNWRGFVVQRLRQWKMLQEKAEAYWEKLPQDGDVIDMEGEE